MKSLKALYRIGVGPSSSHTIGPERIARRFSLLHPDATSFEVTLYGSLSATGKGHGTDEVLRKTLPKPVKINFDNLATDLKHPNTLDITAHFETGESVTVRAYSLGGGAIQFDGEEVPVEADVYPHNTFREIAQYCKENEIRIADYVTKYEGKEILDYLLEVWMAMKNAIKEGLSTSGILPGGLNIERKAKYLYRQHYIGETAEVMADRLVCAYAYAVAEQNAGGGTIVTAPTCGSCGVMPSVLKYMQDTHGFSDEKIVRAIAAGGIIGNLIKTNASISGAECGCQAEIGSACAMTAAALTDLFDMQIEQLEYAAELSIEHHLGLTCDPVRGLVQIPCIERNAVAAMRAINALSLSNFLTYTRRVSFDTIVETMYETGRDLKCGYRETSESGLAKLYRDTDAHEE